jgi:cobalt-zinc-cadmium efflux system outer membrane protein
MTRRGPRPTGLATAFLAWLAVGVTQVSGQGPTIAPANPDAPPRTSRLGPLPGEGAGGGGQDQGAPISGRPGAGVPRVPQSVTTPGGNLAIPSGTVINAPAALPLENPPIYGILSESAEGGEEGPADGMTLTNAIERLIRFNLTLQSLSLEIPQGRADVLTASLRANPVFYADGQLVPYGQYSRQRPGGPTQYDVNVTIPLDVTFKRLARIDVAERAVRVLEARYQDAVRLSIDNLYTAYVDVLAARQTVWYSRASVDGLTRIVNVQKELKEGGARTQAQVDRFVLLRDAADVGLADARANLSKTKRTLATILNMPPEAAETLELRGTLRDLAPPLPPLAELRALALSNRPDVIAFRLGVVRAEADVRLARANRLSDVFLLCQPFTYQNNAPYGTGSATSWALGLTVPLPIFNRNQGNIQRATINVSQTQIELAALERQVISDVEVALNEYEVTRAAVRRLETELIPTARKVRDDTYRLFMGGEVENLEYLNAQRDYNEVVRQYRDYLARHRRSMLDLNTALGIRLLP